jgi:hypothetical protein
MITKIEVIEKISLQGSFHRFPAFLLKEFDSS